MILWFTCNNIEHTVSNHIFNLKIRLVASREHYFLKCLLPMKFILEYAWIVSLLAELIKG